MQLDEAWYEDQLKNISNRTFNTGSLEKRAHAKSLNYTQGGYERGWQYIGIVRATDQGKGVLLEVRCPFKVGDTLSFLDDADLRSITCEKILNVGGEEIENVRASSLVYLPQVDWARPHQVCVLGVDAVAQAKAG